MARGRFLIDIPALPCLALPYPTLSALRESTVPGLPAWDRIPSYD